MSHPLHWLNKNGCTRRIIIFPTPPPSAATPTPSPPERALTRKGVMRNDILLIRYDALALLARILRRRRWNLPLSRRNPRFFFLRVIWSEPRVRRITRAFDLLPPPKGFAWICKKNPNKDLLLMPHSILDEASSILLFLEPPIAAYWVVNISYLDSQDEIFWRRRWFGRQRAPSPQTVATASMHNALCVNEIEEKTNLIWLVMLIWSGMLLCKFPRGYFLLRTLPTLHRNWRDLKKDDYPYKII